MPSPFGLRVRFRSLTVRPNSRSRSTSPAPPPTRVQPLASNSAPLAPIAPAPPTTPIKNLAFISALETHIEDLSPAEKQAFSGSSNITPETLIALIKNYDETHNKTSHSRRCVSRVQGFMTAVDGYLKPVSIMAGHSPEFSLLVVGGVRLIVQLGLKFAAFFNKLTEMMEHLTGHLGYLSQYAENFKHSKKVQDALSSAYRDLLKFCTGARNVFVNKEGNPSRWVSFRVFLRTTWEPFEENFNALDSGFRDHVEIVIRTANIVEHERLRSKEELEAKEKEDENRRKLLLWLSEVEFDKDHDRIFAKRHQDTGNWLLDSPEFKKWDDAQTSSLLWCYGGPGVGKSVLASLVLDKISTKYSLDSRVGIAFVYFNFQEQETQKSIKILSTITKQLARRKKVLPDQLKQFYRGYYRDGEFPNEEALQVQFSELSKTFDQVFLVIDAMDEFEDRKGFLPILTKFALDSSITFKIFVTSRRERDIKNAFISCNFPTIQIEAKKVDVDIATFVRYQMEQRTGEAGVFIDQNLKDKIAHALTSKSSGMFLWVKYQLDYIYEQPSVRDINDALNSLPYDMNATYIRILEKIDKQVPARRKIARRALMWVVWAGTPLTLGQLAIAISIEPGSKSHEELELYDQQAVLEACGNLLTVDDEIVRLVHYTVQEFLTASQSGLTGIDSSVLLRKYQVVTNDNAEIAQTCLQYLLFENFRSCKFSSGGYWRYFKFPFGIYSARYWDYHLKVLQSIPDSLNNIIDIFLDTDGKSLVCAYRMRNKIDGHPNTEIDPLSFCLSIDILHLFQRSHSWDKSIRDSERYNEVLHHAAQGGSTSSIEALLSMGFSVQAYDRQSQCPLYYAAEAGHRKASSLLLEKGADVNAQGGTYGNALQVAAKGGHGSVVQMLLDKGADVNAQGGYYGNALQAAALEGHGSVVQMLLDKGADVNAQGGEYGNALQAAAGGGHGSVVQMLLDKGADVNAQDERYGNALRAAAEEGHGSVVQMLLDKGADVNAQGGTYGNALRAAALGGHGSVVQMLLDKGADVNAQDGYYGNALQVAALGGHGSVVQMLLDKGADVNAQGGEYRNALQVAALGGHGSVVQMLLDKGADVNAQGGTYGNALQVAAKRGHGSVVQMLLDKSADVNAQGGYYGNALQAAAEGGHGSVVQMLLDKGADVNAQGGYYGNALRAAAEGGHGSVVQMLLDKGADVNDQGGFYGNALRAAALGGHGSVVQMFLDKGADINAQGGEYGNALQAAALGGHGSVVQMLLDKGADVNAQGGYYRNALQAAAEGGHGSVVQMLLDKGADVNAQGGEYGNALQAAVMYSHHNIVQILIKAGAHQDESDSDEGDYGEDIDSE